VQDKDHDVRFLVRSALADTVAGLRRVGRI